MLEKSIMKGLADGITKSALKSINNLVSPSKTSNNISNGGTSVGISDNRTNLSSSSKEPNPSSSQPATQYRQCNKCRGTGEIFTTSTVATYGNDKKVVCPECGKEHWLSTVHHHRKCDNCNGSGKVAK